jgi:DNA-binding transcriptional regulator GbsR (MarR family)
MNNMEKQEILRLQVLSTLVGHFIRYWGFRNIHGQIWTVIYLSREPLSGVEIKKLLEVSKALVSPALKELEEEGLIFQAESENSKTKRYAAKEDVSEIIRNVLKRREKPLIDQIQKIFSEIESKDGENSSLDSQRLKNIGSMIQTAQMLLGGLIESDQTWE